MFKNNRPLIIFVFLLLASSNVFAWRESNGGNGVDAEIVNMTGILVNDLRKIPTINKSFDLSKINNQARVIPAWNSGNLKEKEIKILEMILPKACILANCSIDTQGIYQLISILRDIESKHFNSSYPLEIEFVESFKICDANRFLYAYQLVNDSKYVLKNSAKDLDAMLIESQCRNIEFNDSRIKANRELGTFQLSPLEKDSYLYVESVVLKDMAKIPFLKYTYLECSECARTDRSVSQKKNLVLRGVKVDAYTTEKVTSIVTSLDRNAWAELTDRQKYLLTLHETIHYVINLDINYVRSQKVLHLFDRYKKLKALYGQTDDFIIQALRDNLSVCDTAAFKENYALLGGAAYLFKMNGMKIKNAVNASRCSKIIEALPQLNSAEL